MSIINNVTLDITKIYLDEKGKTYKKHTSIIVEVAENIITDLVMKPPKLFDERNQELPDKKYKDSIAENKSMAYSVKKLRFEYILGDGDSYLKDGFKFVINYRYNSGNYFEETYIYCNEKWEREV